MLWFTISSAELAQSMAWCEDRWDEFEPGLTRTLRHGARVSTSDYIAAQRVRFDAAATLETLLAGDAVLVTPTCNVTSWEPNGPLPTTAGTVTRRSGHRDEHRRAQLHRPSRRLGADGPVARGCPHRVADRRTPVRRPARTRSRGRTRVGATLATHRAGLRTVRDHLTRARQRNATARASVARCERRPGAGVRLLGDEPLRVPHGSVLADDEVTLVELPLDRLEPGPLDDREVHVRTGTRRRGRSVPRTTSRCGARGSPPRASSRGTVRSKVGLSTHRAADP